MTARFLIALSPLALLAASCSGPAAGDSPAIVHKQEGVFTVEELGRFEEPWAMAVLPHGDLLVTEKAGKIKLRRSDGTIQDIPLPVPVDYCGQGGLGDIVLSPDFAQDGRFYLSWAAKGPNDTRGAEVGRGTLVFDGEIARIADFRPFWMQVPKVTGRGHYSHRMAISPDGKYLFIASGERQKFTPAQDMNTNLGKIIRLEVAGEAVPADNPFAAQGGIAATVWTLGHRNILGLQFAPDGRLWEIEHGPAGGDELNLVRPGANYGWPVVSEGRHYNGQYIPHHDTHPEFAAPALYWNPVIAPGGMIFYTGAMWPEWRGQALIAALGGPGGLVRVRIDGDKAVEEARYPLGNRIRAVTQADDGSLLVLEDGPGARLLRLTRK
ncbi:MAG: PQQ-dependent sugar dehydrogenase [Novosphingobium sp.]